MTAPESFTRQLAAEFNGQIRARWSRARNRWIIERKRSVGMADESMPPLPMLSRIGNPDKRRKITLGFDDRLEQARGGFYTIFELTPGDRTECPRCDRMTHIPVRQWRSARCEFCNKEFSAFFDDRLEQARGGFYTIFELTPGDRTECPRCDRMTHIPVRQWRSARCEFCNKEFSAFFFPLGEDVLTRLRLTDPDRGGLERIKAIQESFETSKESLRKRQLSQETEAIWKDAYTQIAGIESVGYTGKELTASD